ncbi:glutathione S-transferase family protein [Tatumella sp. TA1]|nr:glutathione S-transferase family protein [Tatumella sp. TA1]
MKLYVGTESTWSLRALICLAISQIDAQVQCFTLRSEEGKRALQAVSPTRLVPLLDDEGTIIHDSLAITEYLNEVAPGRLYPTERAQRAVCRSLCAEMHSGFLAIRQSMPFTTETVTRDIQPSDAALREIERLTAIFAAAQGRFLFGDAPTAADAFYAVMAYRLNCYHVVLEGRAGEYQQNAINWDVLQHALESLR